MVQVRCERYSIVNLVGQDSAKIVYSTISSLLQNIVIEAVVRLRNKSEVKGPWVLRSSYRVVKGLT